MNNVNNATSPTIRTLGLISIAALQLAGCALEDGSSTTTNSPLGIARFATETSAQGTIMLGLDASGNEVAHLELARGVFAPTGMFAEEYTSATIDGRQITAGVGKVAYHFETEGYGPLMEMPRQPANFAEIQMLLDEPQIKAELARWNFGYVQPAMALDGEVDYQYINRWYAYRRGASETDCSTSSCGSVRGININTCGGSNNALNARYVTQTSGSHDLFTPEVMNGGGYNNYGGRIIFQACPTSNTFDYKYCPIDNNDLRTPVSNATTTVACRGVASYTDADADFPNTTYSFVGNSSSPVESVYELAGGFTEIFIP